MVNCGNVETNTCPDLNPPVKELLVYHLNIRNLRNKIHFLENIDSEYHVICVTETHLDSNVLTDYI